MSKPKLTDWFPVDTKPMRVGVYETKAQNHFDGTRFQFWNGQFWCAYCPTAERAAHESNSNKSSVQNPAWRERANNPKRKK